MLEINQIYNMDCIEGMKKVSADSIDMILCDPPYQITNRNNWDVQLPLDDVWKQYKRIIKEKGIIVLTSFQPFTSILVNSNLKWFRYSLVWDKVRGVGFLNSKKKPLNRHEDILIFYKKFGTYNPQMTQGKYYKRQRAGAKESTNYGKYDPTYSRHYGSERFPVSIIKFPTLNAQFRNSEYVHPTQKPLELFEYLIKTYSNEDDVILDNCMGSGTTAVACKRLNRQFIGFEINKEFYDISLQRLLNVPERLDRWIKT